MTIITITLTYILHSVNILHSTFSSFNSNCCHTNYDAWQHCLLWAAAFCLPRSLRFVLFSTDRESRSGATVVKRSGATRPSSYKDKGHDCPLRTKGMTALASAN